MIAGSCVSGVATRYFFAIIRGNGLKLLEMIHMFEKMAV